MNQPKRRKWKLKAFGVLFLLVAAFGFYRWFYAPEIALGAKAIEILRNPDRVEVLKLAASPFVMDATQNGNTQNLIGGRKVVAVGKTLGKESVLKLGNLLTERNALLPQFDFSCGFSPGLAFRFSKGSTKVTVSACYMCQHLWFLTTDKDQRITQHFMSYDVDNLKPFFQQGFPQDKKLFDREIESDN